MAAWERVLPAWRWFVAVFHATTRNRTTIPPESETSCISDLEKLRQEIYVVGIYDLHNILRRSNRVEWCEWHLKMDKNDNVIKIANNFHKNFEKLKSSPCIDDKIDTIEKIFLEFMSPDDQVWNAFRDSLEHARKNKSVMPIIKAYTLAQGLSERLNKHLAVNTKHALKLYCTLLNCPTLALTQEYIEAIISLFFHPELEDYLVRKKTVYRGIVLKNKELVADYKKGATIITTTLLSTSPNPEVADNYSDTPFEDSISIRCKYNINNTHRQTALNVRQMTHFRDEEEILILPYVPFTITLLEPTDDGREMTIWFDECNDHEEEQPVVQPSRSICSCS